MISKTIFNDISLRIYCKNIGIKELYYIYLIYYIYYYIFLDEEINRDLS